MRSFRRLTIAAGALVLAVGLAGLGLVFARTTMADTNRTGWACPYFGGNAGNNVGNGWAGRGYGGMMGGGYGGGMMGPGYGRPGWGSGTPLAPDPLTLAQAETAVEEYLSNLGNDDLEIAEIMIFDNHAYAEVIESSTGVGAMELLVDPRTLAVFPEPGPNMMWNLKYGHMAGWGYGGMMGGGMMGPGWGWGGTGPGRGSSDPADMPVTPTEAIEAAQSYLDGYLAGAVAGDEADVFYGYYTIHVLRDGEITGMLGVNGYSGQVFYHSWHGEFVTMSEEHGV